MLKEEMEMIDDIKKARDLMLYESKFIDGFSIDVTHIRRFWEKFKTIFGITHFSAKTIKKLNSLSPNNAYIEIANILGLNTTNMQLLDNITGLEQIIDTQNKAVNRHLKRITELTNDLNEMNNLNTDLNNKIDSLPDTCDHYEYCSQTAISNHRPEEDPNN